jgi:vacuolar-type H+-ATPase subunit H
MSGYDMIVSIVVSASVSLGIAHLMIRMVVEDLANQINDANNKMQQAINDSREDSDRIVAELTRELNVLRNRETLINELQEISEKKDIRRVVENRI